MEAGQEGKEGSGLIDVGEVVEAEVWKYDKPRHAKPSANVTFSGLMQEVHMSS